MTRTAVAAALAAALAAGAAQAADRAKAEVFCQPTEQPLTYDCMIALSNARTGAPLEGVDVTVGAEMPSMPMAHNVRPVKAVKSHAPGHYHARITVEMHGEWALRLDLSGAMRDRLVETVELAEPGAMPAMRGHSGMQHGHGGHRAEEDAGAMPGHGGHKD